MLFYREGRCICVRTTNIKVSLEIPVPIDKPDKNGVIYTEDAIKKACENAKGLPIILYNSDNSTKTIGITDDVQYENGYILTTGTLRYGGTEEQVVFNDENKIMSMEIVGFGID